MYVKTITLAIVVTVSAFANAAPAPVAEPVFRYPLRCNTESGLDLAEQGVAVTIHKIRRDGETTLTASRNPMSLRKCHEFVNSDGNLVEKCAQATFRSWTEAYLYSMATDVADAIQQLWDACHADGGSASTRGNGKFVVHLSKKRI